MATIVKLLSVFCLVSIPNNVTTTPKGTLLKTQQHHSKRTYNFRVHKGRDVAEGEYPFVIVIFTIIKDDGFWRMCTGSMISATWGITAAHCLEIPHLMIQYDNFTESPLDSGCYVPVIEMFSHPAYRSIIIDGENTILDNDIGVFRSKSVPKKPYAVLLSTDYSTLIGLPVVYVGAGMTTWDLIDDDDYRPLQLGEATIITCDEEMRIASKFVICLASKCSNRLEVSWYGDSGGPLIYEGKVIGVCSYGIESKILTRSGYTPVSPYIDWIHLVTSVTGA